MTSEGNFVQPAIPRFDGHYDHWSMLMENFLRSKKYWSLVETGYEEPNNSGDHIEEGYVEGDLGFYEEEVRGECQSEEVMTVANKMRVYGVEMKDVTIVENILRSLTDKFNYIVCSIKESKDIDKLSIDELQSSLIVHKQKFHRQSGEEQALKYECPTWGKEANYAKMDEQEEMLLMAYIEINRAKREDAWFLDSGCSNHMCGDRSLFSELDESFRQMVKLGNNTRMSVAGKGSVKLQLNGFNLVISGVFFVPELKNNLLSIGQLQERGLAILIQAG
ncbi:uncharacterized protein LOC133730517 [Rosa rugosa]|uniref:uncharacterized protein LOC133730517 n=1 Tax=Rosa rugosa TaxID=74645 RepID=UPI002B4131AD|nr:uncharacterized protein LOC133730517 [Rosa rugosa]